MKTEHLDASDPTQVARAIELLAAGELVAVPTETVYGLAADATNPTAVAKIFQAKGRPSNHPLIVHLPNIKQLSQWATNIPELAERIAQTFWPGPLTLLLEKHPGVNSIITGGLATVGLRMPNHPVLSALLQSANLAVAAPSANPYQQLSPTTAEHVLNHLDGKISAVLDAGPCPVGSESTIVRVIDNSVEILRSGPISAEQLASELKVKVFTPSSHDVAVSGNKEIHYSPRASVKLIPREHVINLATALQSTALLYYSDLDTTHFVASVQLPKDIDGYRHSFYAGLHSLDSPEVTDIWIEAPPTSEPWSDIHDRLQRASAS
ncbi:MAG: L-threonylcarbamoyladenylate synthase [Kangiellaceae bacterium]|jgi:L-threonylcarbamoyladenylate synthase|nr:L-threonylcarbamoyladenylate synthase [Kangiellaceae bacterium]